MGRIELARLPKKDLIKLVELYSQNALTIDGLWFIGVEERFGLGPAIEIDTATWRRYGATEARRIVSTLGIRGSPVEVLARALNYQVWIHAPRMQYDVSQPAQNRVIFSITDCSVQRVRERDQRPLFPCKPVGVALWEEFGKAIDPRFALRCVVCPPDEHPDDLWCSWEFELRT
ncbi:MAG: DUF6125 family protein [Chloroflexota bacterium]